MRSRITMCLGTSAGLIALLACVGTAETATSTDIDILRDQAAPPAVNLFDIEKPTQPAQKRAQVRPTTGNPLWSIPLSKLSATRERPIFSASRRPRTPAVVAPTVEATVSPVLQTAPEPLTLVLIGAVVSDTDAIAVFVDRVSREVVRLRKGEARGGWELSSVAGREATLRNGERTESLVLLKPDTPLEASPAAMPSSALPPGIGVPFVPRSTPKNGESDGL